MHTNFAWITKKKKRRNKERKRKKIHNEISRSKMTWCLGFAKKIEKEKKGIDIEDTAQFWHYWISRNGYGWGSITEFSLLLCMFEYS